MSYLRLFESYERFRELYLHFKGLYLSLTINKRLKYFKTQIFISPSVRFDVKCFQENTLPYLDAKWFPEDKVKTFYIKTNRAFIFTFHGERTSIRDSQALLLLFPQDHHFPLEFSPSSLGFFRSYRRGLRGSAIKFYLRRFSSREQFSNVQCSPPNSHCLIPT